eukprot:1003676-Pelagomonas_calceolata.AAC.2
MLLILRDTMVHHTRDIEPGQVGRWGLLVCVSHPLTLSPSGCGSRKEEENYVGRVNSPYIN